MTRRPAIRCVLVAIGLVAAGACGADRRGRRASMDSRPTTDVLARVIRAGAARDRSELAFLVGRLEDQRLVVRQHAIESLSSITGTRLGYHPLADPAVRAESVGRWRLYLDSDAGANDAAAARDANVDRTQGSAGSDGSGAERGKP